MCIYIVKVIHLYLYKLKIYYMICSKTLYTTLNFKDGKVIEILKSGVMFETEPEAYETCSKIIFTTYQKSF